MESQVSECKLCDRDVTEAEGPVHGNLHGFIQITFCPECYSALDIFFSEKKTKSVDTVINN